MENFTLAVTGDVTIKLEKGSKTTSVGIFSGTTFTLSREYLIRLREFTVLSSGEFRVTASGSAYPGSMTLIFKKGHEFIETKLLLQTTYELKSTVVASSITLNNAAVELNQQLHDFCR